MNESKLWTKDFIILCISNFVLSFSFYAILAILPLYLSTSLKFFNSQIGPVMAAYTLGALLIRPLSGYFFDYFNKKRTLLISILLFAFLFSLYNYFYNVSMISFLRFIHGFTWGFITTGMVTVTIDIIPAEKRGQGIGYLGIAMTLAMALAPPVAIAASKLMSFNTLFFSATLIAVVSFICAWFLKIKSHPKNVQKGGIVLFVKSALPVSFSLMLFTIAYGSIMSFITLYALELGIKNAGRFFFFMALGLIITRLFSGKVFDNYGPKWVSIGGFMSGIAGFILLSLVQEEILFLVAALFIGLGFGSIVPASQAMINNMVEAQRRGAANSTFLTFFDLGIGLGMVITGALASSFGYRWNYFICAGISGIGLIIFVFWALRYYFNHQLVKTK